MTESDTVGIVGGSGEPVPLKHPASAEVMQLGASTISLDSSTVSRPGLGNARPGKQLARHSGKHRSEQNTEDREWCF